VTGEELALLGRTDPYLTIRLRYPGCPAGVADLSDAALPGDQADLRRPAARRRSSTGPVRRADSVRAHSRASAGSAKERSPLRAEAVLPTAAMIATMRSIIQTVVVVQEIT